MKIFLPKFYLIVLYSIYYSHWLPLWYCMYIYLYTEKEWKIIPKILVEIDILE